MFSSWHCGEVVNVVISVRQHVSRSSFILATVHYAAYTTQACSFAHLRRVFLMRAITQLRIRIKPFHCVTVSVSRSIKCCVEAR